MLIEYANDGEEFNKDWLIQNGFSINIERDFRKKTIYDIDTGEPTDKYSYVLDFVGFLVNNNNDVFAVFPKNYRVNDLNKDSDILFNVISKHIQKRPDFYIGSEYGDKFKSNYPFSAFFGIYEYYSRYGIYFENELEIKPSIGGKVDWKETIRLSSKYLTNGKVSFYPIYYQKKRYFPVLLTDCVVYAIDYTIEKFNVFLSLEKTGMPFPNTDIIHEKKIILEYLISLRDRTFKDSLVQLITHLINFYSQLNQGGSYYIKHYSFSSIWEDMVGNYLRLNYSEIKNDKIVFDATKSKKINFNKKTFRPNIANSNHYFQPDYYYEDDDTQLIFDAKYYSKSYGMDYKQIAYFLFLKEHRNSINENPKFSQTISALLLPSELRESKVHFRIDPIYSITNQDIIIYEEHLDIREVMENYLD